MESAPAMGGTPLPRHVAFIMDGNGRWAKERDMPRTEGHRRGVETVRTVLNCAQDWGIPYISLYAFSTENWKRPEQEVNVLFELLATYIDRELDRFRRDQVRMRFLGDHAILPERAKEAVAKAEEATAEFDRWNVLVALNYGGRDEILRGIRRWHEDPAGPAPADLDEVAFGSYLDTHPAPDPDLLVRTSGEQRLSNFLLWQLAYAEFAFVPERWPDFDAAVFRRTLEDYARRDRRFGLTGDQLEQQGKGRRS